MVSGKIRLRRGLLSPLPEHNKTRSASLRRTAAGYSSGRQHRNTAMGSSHGEVGRDDMSRNLGNPDAEKGSAARFFPSISRPALRDQRRVSFLERPMPIKTVAIIDGNTGFVNTFAQDLMTDGGTGPNRRLRVDVGQTGFFAGREFRTFRELNIAASATFVIKAVVPIDVILFGLKVSIESGQLRLATVAGGTPGGSFSETLPIFGRNNMSERPTPFYTPQVALTAGGTHTGGTEIDILRLKANANTNQASTVGGEGGDERGVAAATYHFRLQNLSGTDAVVGVFSARWEERV